VLIRGLVRGPDGSVLEGAVITTQGAPTEMPDIAAVTGDDGRFVLAAPVAGRYRLGVRADGHTFEVIDIDVADADVSVECQLRNE
jgi:hypothetical protein